MSDGLCDICGERPATVRVAASVNGQRRMIELCNQDFESLKRQNEQRRSPLESLFGDHPMSSMLGSMGDDPFDSDRTRRTPRRSREAADVADVLSERA